VDVERLTAGGTDTTQEHVPDSDVKDNQVVLRTDKMVSDDPIACGNLGTVRQGFRWQGQYGVSAGLRFWPRRGVGMRRGLGIDLLATARQDEPGHSIALRWPDGRL
jgi:hypothetical protein